jgi:hypothetical protein
MALGARLQYPEKRKLLISASFIFLFINIFVAPNSSAQVLIFTTAYNRPDFIELQYKTFKKFLKDDYKFIIFNDADSDEKECAIREMCEQLNIECVRIPQCVHTHPTTMWASCRHGEAVQFAFEHSGFKHDDIVVLLDSDEFLLHEWSIREFLGEADIYVLHDQRFGWHMKPQLTILNMPNIPDAQTLNFRPGWEPSIKTFVDTGGLTKSYLLAHPKLRLKRGTMVGGLYSSDHASNGPFLYLNKHSTIAAYLGHVGYTDEEIKFINAIYNLTLLTSNVTNTDIGFYEKNLFLDYKHGSGWCDKNFNVKTKKDALIKNFINSLLEK